MRLVNSVRGMLPQLSNVELERCGLQSMTLACGQAAPGLLYPRLNDLQHRAALQAYRWQGKREKVMKKMPSLLRELMIFSP